MFVRIYTELAFTHFGSEDYLEAKKKTHLTVTVSSYLLLQDGIKKNPIKTCHTSKRFPLKKKNHLEQQLYNS